MIPHRNRCRSSYFSALYRRTLVLLSSGTLRHPCALGPPGVMVRKRGQSATLAADLPLRYGLTLDMGGRAGSLMAGLQSPGPCRAAAGPLSCLTPLRLPILGSV